MFPVKDRIWRLPPCPPYDVEGMESWLSDMAAQGWKLEPDDFFLGIASFRKTDPAPVRYRLEASQKRVSAWDDDGGVPDREAWELNTDCGWEYAGRRGQFFIYRTSDERARELHTDPQVQALAVKAVEKRQCRSFIWLICYQLVFGLAHFWKGFSPLLAAAFLGLPLFLLFAALLLAAMGTLLAEVLYLHRLKRKLLGGMPPDRDKDWRRARWGYHGRRAALLLLLALCVILSFRTLGRNLNHEDRTALQDYAGEVPFATVADFAEGEYRETWMDIHYDYVSEWSNALLERGMTWSENARVTRPDGSTLRGVLKVDYFAARSEWLAKRIAAEYRRAGKAKAWKNYEPLKLPDLGLDEQAAYRNELHFPTVVLRKGNVVVGAMFYSGSGSITLEEWAKVMADSLD